MHDWPFTDHGGRMKSSWVPSILFEFFQTKHQSVDRITLFPDSETLKVDHSRSLSVWLCVAWVRLWLWVTIDGFLRCIIIIWYLICMISINPSSSCMWLCCKERPPTPSPNHASETRWLILVAIVLIIQIEWVDIIKQVRTEQRSRW